MVERIRNRMAMETDQIEDGLWRVREAEAPYSLFSGPKDGAKGQNP